jgi:PAS domain S-box-containing protein
MEEATLRRYALALCAVALAAALRAGVDPWLLGEAPFATYFVAVVGSAWCLGTGPALVATVAGVVATVWLIVPPPEAAALAVFLGLGTVLAVFGGGRRDAATRLARALVESVERERELARQQEQYAVTLASIGDAVITTDAHGQITYLNPVACTLTRWSLDDARGLPLERVFRIVNEYTRQTAESPVRQALATGRIVGLANHTLLIARDGTELAIDDSASPIFEDGRGTGDGGGIAGRARAIRGGVLIFRDVTERRRIEADRARLAAIVGHSDDAVLSMSLTGDIASWNAAAERLYGYPEKDVVGRHVSALVPADRMDELLRVLDALGRGEAPEPLETVALARGQTRVDVSLRLSPLRNHEGELIGASAIVRDVTERKRAERALRCSEQQLAEFFENAAIAIHWLDADGIILRANRAELAMLGYEEAEYIGRHIADFHADRAVMEDVLARLVSGRTLEDHAARMRRKDGSIVDVRMHASAHFEADRFASSRWFTRDVTAQVYAERALRENEARLRLALEADHMGTWEWTIASGRVVWSPGLEAIHGLAPGTFAGTFEAFSADMHPDDRERVLRAVRDTLERGDDHRVEYRIVREGGEVHWVEGRGKRFRDAGGAPERMLGVCMDVSERVRTERSSRFLADASAALANPVDYESTLERVAQLAVPEFADWCGVDLVQPDGSLRRVAVAHVDPAKVALAHEVHHRYPPDPNAPVGAPHVLRTGEAELIEEIPDALWVRAARDADHLRLSRELGLRSYMGVPLRSKQRILGVMVSWPRSRAAATTARISSSRRIWRTARRSRSRAPSSTASSTCATAGRTSSSRRSPTS